METNVLSRYRTRGEIIFELATVDGQHDLFYLVAALQEADEANPWIAHYKSDGKRAPSMVNIRIGAVYESGGFQVRPISFEPNFDLKSSQLVAYERYLSRLAQELAKKGISCVRGVIGQIMLTKDVSYWGSKSQPINIKAM